MFLAKQTISWKKKRRKQKNVFRLKTFRPETKFSIFIFLVFFKA